MTHVFIDGQAGTTGLQIRERLAAREDVTLIEIPESSRKDPEVRRQYLNEADVVILCLPDDAAREALGLISSNRVRVLDASTAYRVADGWAYGLPELDADQRARVRDAARVSNPGCYPTGFVLLVRPLVGAGIVPARCTPVVSRDFGLLRRRTPAHRALRGTRGRASDVAVARAAVRVRFAPQAPAGDGAVLRHRAAAGVLADGGALRAGNARDGAAARGRAGR